MYIRLERIVSRLSELYPVKVTHQMTGGVASMARLPDKAVELEPDVLYVCSPGELAQRGDREDAVAILCVIPSQFGVDKLIFPMRKVILAECQDMSAFLLKLSEIMFALGTESSAIDEYAARLLACTTCAQLVETGASILENPVLITDSLLNVIQYSQSPNMDRRQWQSFVNDGHLVVSTSKLGSIMMDELSLEGQTTCVTIEGESAFPPMIQKAITGQGYFLGNLFVPAFVRPLTEKDIEICSIMGNLAAPLLMNREQFLYPVDSPEAYLSSLIEIGMVLEEEVNSRLKKLDYKIKPHMYIMVMSNNGQLIGKNLRETAREITAAVPEIKALLHRSEMVFLLETNVSLAESDERIGPLYKLLAENSARMGLSRDFSSPVHIRKAYLQARKAMELGEALEPDFHFHPYERYGAYHMLEMCASYENLDTFQFPNFQELRKYDSENDGELVKTLFSYLHHCGSLSKMSADLYIHQNTVRYRISQISRILRCDLSDGETFFQLCLTERIIRLRQFADPAMTSLGTKQQWLKNCKDSKKGREMFP